MTLGSSEPIISNPGFDKSVWRQSPSGVPLHGQAQEAESAPPTMGHRRPGPGSASPSSQVDL